MCNPLEIINLINDLGILTNVQQKLTVQKDPAAEKLAEVLDELAKMVAALDTEIVRYLGLYLEPGESLIAGRLVLLSMDVGQARVRVNEARGHCHKIKNIYDKFLERWFAQLLNRAEQDQLRGLFSNLTHADAAMLRAMQQLSDWLEGEAGTALERIEGDDLASANQQIAHARAAIKPHRKALIDALVKLREIQAAFIFTAGTV